jgi:magnesium chelatase family protein
MRGCEIAKRAMVVAAAGNHGILMFGSPATGKTMLAERIPGIMPPMTYEEIMEVTRIYSAAGLLDADTPYIDRRPFRMPYHGITRTALIGGGQYPRPGEITLADKGVLFLDEFCEFDRSTIDMLRQPMETRKVEVTRLADSFTYPADFLLVAASNPCKCGYYGEPGGKCTCSATSVDRYQARISGPVLDRIDIHISLTQVDYNELTCGENTSTETMRERVSMAREIQKKRFEGEEIEVNSQMNSSQCDRFVQMDEEAKGFLMSAYDTLKLNPRTLLKTKKLARTIADLEGDEVVGEHHLLEAVGYRRQEVRHE